MRYAKDFTHPGAELLSAPGVFLTLDYLCGVNSGSYYNLMQVRGARALRAFGASGLFLAAWAAKLSHHLCPLEKKVLRIQIVYGSMSYRRYPNGQEIEVEAKVATEN